MISACDELAKMQSKVNVTLNPVYLFIKQLGKNGDARQLNFFK